MTSSLWTTTRGFFSYALAGLGASSATTALGATIRGSAVSSAVGAAASGNVLASGIIGAALGYFDVDQALIKMPDGYTDVGFWLKMVGTIGVNALATLLGGLMVKNNFSDGLDVGETALENLIGSLTIAGSGIAATLAVKGLFKYCPCCPSSSSSIFESNVKRMGASV